MRKLLVGATLMVLGCGPAFVSEARTAFYPSRGANCALEFVKVDMMQLAPGMGKYEVVGHVTIGETGIQDPFSERYRAIVRPRACNMGGEAVTILVSAANQTVMGSGSGTIYTILRARQAAGAAPQPF